MNRTRTYWAALAILLPILGTSPFTVAAAAQTTYYVSQSDGNDDHDGQAATCNGTQGPWKTLAKASSATYQPGDQLLLKCGDIWNETLTLRGDGTADSPITVASYGDRRAAVHPWQQ